MIEFELLEDCKGSNRFGSCSSCGAYEDKKKLARFRFMHEGQGTSVCLCDDCIDKLTELIFIHSVLKER